MPDLPPPPKFPGAMTLHEARQTIASLRRQLGNGPPAGKPLPGKVDTQPTAGDRPVPKTPEDPHPILPGRTEPINPENLNHKALASLIESRSTAELFKMIRKETDGRVMAAIRKELGNRGAA